MFDIGWTELLLIGVVALIVVGPKDLPGMFRTLGQVTARIKAMAREFQTTMEAAAEDSGVKDVAKDLKEFSSPSKFGMNKVTDAVKEFEKWSPDAGSGRTAGSATSSDTSTSGETSTAPAADDGPSDPALAAERAADAARGAKTKPNAPAPETARETGAEAGTDTNTGAETGAKKGTA